jgi:hypothetical protein
MNEQDNPQALTPSYALRAWLTSLLDRTDRATADLQLRVAAYEKELARLRGQMQRSRTASASLRDAVSHVDSVLRNWRDTHASN